MIIGENGAGKSTLLKIILGLIFSDSGQVIKNDLMIGYVPERIDPPPFVSVRKFLEIINDIKNGDKKDIDYYLEYWELNDSNKKLSELSKGMLQKVIITQAFLGSPECLIFDEALNGLDKTMQKKLLNLIRKEKKKGKIIIITSHYQDYYKDVVDITLTIRNGKIWEN